MRLFLESKEGRALTTRLMQLKKKVEDAVSSYVEAKVLRVTDKIEATARRVDDSIHQFIQE